MTLDRRHDIDWLRVITIGLLLIYHTTISFQSWAGMLYFPQSSQTMAWLWYPMSLLNVWRIPLLFFVSGMGVCFAMRKRNWKQLIGERTRRIQIPYIFGILAIVPLQLFVFQWGKGVTLSYLPNPGHLWFLGNIYAYTLILSPLFFYLKNRPESKFAIWVKRGMAHPAGLVVMCLFFVAEVLLVSPATFEYYAMNMHGFYLGLIAFLFGFLIVYSGEKFWNMLLRMRWITLAVATGLYIVRLTVFQIKAPFYLISLESSFWIMTVLAFGNLYLNKSNKSLRYLSGAAYPIYILHMLWHFVGATVILKMSAPGIVQWLLLNVFIFAACFASYELFRRIPYIRGLFGMDWTRTKSKPTLETSSTKLATS